VGIVAGILAGIGTLSCLIGLPLYYSDEVYDDEDKKAFWKIAKKLIILCIVLWIVCIFIPSKETLIEMQVAKYATYENAEWTVENVKQAVDYIINALKELK
jgi:hypothetical protein